MSQPVLRDETTLSEDGLIEIPERMRERLGIAPHDRLVIAVEDDGIVIRPIRSRIARHFASVQPRSRPEDWQAIRDETWDALARDVVAEDRP